MKKLINFIKNNKAFVISIAILLGGQSLTFFTLKFFQNNPIYIDYYLDDKIPFLGRFVYIYNAFYPFVFICFYLLYKKEEKTYFKGVISGIIGFLICDIIFLSLPTIMYRPILPNIDPITDFVLKLTFYYDAPPLNCFPSIHCLYCFQVIYSILSSKFNKKSKLLIVFIALLIIASTLLIKQHYIYDVISAFLVMMISNLLTDLFNIYDRLKSKRII